MVKIEAHGSAYTESMCDKCNKLSNKKRAKQTNQTKAVNTEQHWKYALKFQIRCKMNYKWLKINKCSEIQFGCSMEQQRLGIAYFSLDFRLMWEGNANGSL